MKFPIYDYITKPINVKHFMKYYMENIYFIDTAP